MKYNSYENKTPTRVFLGYWAQNYNVLDILFFFSPQPPKSSARHAQGVCVGQELFKKRGVFEVTASISMYYLYKLSIS